MALERLAVGADTVRMLKLGHPWVIADKHTARWPSRLRLGQLAELVSPEGESLGTALIEPGARIIARLLSADAVCLERDWFQERFRAAERLRRDCLNLEATDAWRLVNGEGDGLPGLTVEHYGDWLMLQLYTPAWEPHLDTLIGALAKQCKPAGIYLKQRPQQTRELAGQLQQEDRLVKLVAGQAAPELLTVRENGLAFQVRLNEGLHTGLFLDQRDNRTRFRNVSQGRATLNLFCFTGAFSVVAAAGGASTVTSVDVSRRYLDWTRENLQLNDLPLERHELLPGDCLKVLRRLAADGRTFNLAFVDPPSFSTTKRGKFTTKGGTGEILTALFKVLEPGALLFACSNHQKTDWSDYLKELRRGALDAEVDLQILELHGQGADFVYPAGFPDGRYLKCLMARVKP